MINCSILNSNWLTGNFSTPVQRQTQAGKQWEQELDQNISIYTWTQFSQRKFQQISQDSMEN